jgi:hypothetical protein
LVLQQRLLEADFKVHKLRCAPTIPYNCFVIRATPASDDQSDSAYIEPFPLKSYGNWSLEMKELKERLGWKVLSSEGHRYLVLLYVSIVRSKYPRESSLLVIAWDEPSRVM